MEKEGGGERESHEVQHQSSCFVNHESVTSIHKDDRLWGGGERGEEGGGIKTSRFTMQGWGYDSTCLR